MKSILLLMALIVISESRNIRNMSYEDHVLRGGLQIPQAIRDANPGVWYRHQLEDLNMSTNIVGGVDAVYGQIPYVASVRKMVKSNVHFCSASLVNNRWVASAAHCTIGGQTSPERKLIVRYNSLSHNSGGTLVEVLRIIVHELYDPITLNNDIALLLLSESIIFGPQAQPIPLVPHGHDPQAGQINVVSGWGPTLENGSLLPTLKTVRNQIITRVVCNTVYGAHITDQHICDKPAGGYYSCVGTSGGPYVIDGKLAGIISWGYECATPTQPGVATRVGAYTNWINARIDY